VILPLPPAPEQPHPPIPVRFHLAKDGFVTLVIDDNATLRRVRNLVSETWFAAGDNVVWWDGCDDLGRDQESARHGIYNIPAHPVTPGRYRVRGLTRGPLGLRFEFSIYNAGHPAWETADNTGCWLTNHTPPQAALYVPGDRSPTGGPLVYLGSYVSEGGHGLAWVDLDGVKQGGRGWVGGNWTAAPFLCRDSGEHRDANTFLYVGSAWEGELRLTAITTKGDKPVVKYQFAGGKAASALAGIAVRDGLLAASLPKQKSVLLVDAKAGKVLGELPVDDPRGVWWLPSGELLALAGKQLLRLTLDPNFPQTVNATHQTVIAEGLEDPQQVTTDRAGNLYVSDQGASHQVKVFSSAGKLLRAIGHAGAPAPGPYDPLHMNHPEGLTIDERDHLWVAEQDYQPKRVSVWTLDGQLVKAFYGPGQYGGGGTLDPRDKTRFYYNGMEFKLDWKAGTDRLVNVFHRPLPGDMPLPNGFGTGGEPEFPIYAEGRQYFSNWNDSNPTNGAPIAIIWQLKDGLARPVAALGRANDWDLLKTAPFKKLWPAGIDLKGEYWRNQCLFLWSDRNGDGQCQPEEVTMIKAAGGGVTVGDDLSFVESRVDGTARRYKVTGFAPGGAPLYDLAAGEALASGVNGPTSSGGDQALVSPSGWTVETLGVAPFAPESICGVFGGQARWQYPSLWPGLHASHESPPPDRTGELIGTTRLLGSFVSPTDSNAGRIFAVNGNMGPMYLLTEDGLFVASLFRDMRAGRSWSMPNAVREMPLDDVSPHDENFWPSITQTADGQVYLVDGARTSLVRVDGLSSIRRLPDTGLDVTPAMLQACAAWTVQSETLRQAALGPKQLKVALRAVAPTVDGKLDDWAGAAWASIDKRGVAAYFDSNSKPYDVTGAVAIAGDRLYAAFRTGDKDLLRNSGEVPNAPFKCGGALDLMIGANPTADPKRARPVAGDLRLCVTRVKGKTLALLYRAVVPGTKEPVPFSSPWRTITFDQVQDVSDQVQLASGPTGEYELSVPLATLGLGPKPGLTIQADLGVLRGNGFQTTQRVYWSNKATGITADVPSEAELTPALWGRWTFVTESN
jgi:DNA-binding beta-propeller fold protein YncE